MGNTGIKDIESRLIKQLCAILLTEPAKIRSDEPLHKLGVDSLSFVELLVFIEKEFNIKLMESGLNKEDFKTVHSLASSIQRIKG
jgi:acyl carrier protein